MQLAKRAGLAVKLRLVLYLNPDSNKFNGTWWNWLRLALEVNSTCTG